MSDMGKDKGIKVEKEWISRKKDLADLNDTLSEIKNIFADQANQAAASMDNLKDKINAFIEKQEDNIDLMLYKYIHHELDKETEENVGLLISSNEKLKKKYDEMSQLSNMIAETYSAEIKQPMPESMKKILNKYEERKGFKLFSVAGLSSLAAVGWLGTISLGTYQFLGIMATTTVPTAVMRSAPSEDEIEFDLLNIGEDNCITLTYDMPDSPSAITKQICLD